MDLYQILKDFGFPVFVSAFLLVRLEPTLMRVNETLKTIQVTLAKINGGKEALAAHKELELERLREQLAQIQRG